MSKDYVRKNLINCSNCNKTGLLSVLALIIILASLVIISCNKNETEIYSFHGQTVQLLADGNFNASLAHGVKKSGTYSKTTENNRIIVSFIVNGNTETGRIINNALHLPKEWDDGHNHGNIFPKVTEAHSNQEHGHDH
ncbi:MAG: hypothetical protein FWB83_10375, partial [Treponema sp.]|nr:hypothetical protein [Treponema sp.]